MSATAGGQWANAGTVGRIEVDEGEDRHSSTGARLEAESLLFGHRYVTLPPLGRRRLLVCASSPFKRRRLARSAMSWGRWRRGLRGLAGSAAAAASSAWCVLSPGRTLPPHSLWRNPTLDLQLRNYVEDSTSMVVLAMRDYRRHVQCVATRRGETVFIKAVDSAEGVTELANEVRMLREFGAGCAPKLLHSHFEAEAAFIVTEAVDPVLRRPSLLPDAEAVGLLESLPRRGERDLETHPWMLPLLTPSCHPDVLRWSEALEGRRWPLVVLHGDFLPWHLATRAGGERVLMDWGSGSLAGFPGVDAAEWVIGVGARLGHSSVAALPAAFTSWACSRELGGTRLTTDEARAILALTAYRRWRCSKALRIGAKRDQQAMVALWKYDKG